MKLVSAILLFFVSTVFGAEISNRFTYKEGQRYFFAPGKDGKIQLVDLLEKDPINRFNPEEDVTFKLYTRDNPTSGQIIEIDNVESLESSNYDDSKETKIIIHGWTGSADSSLCYLPRDQYLEVFDVNFICADWSPGSSGLYSTAAENVPATGQMMARFVDWLITQGSSIESFHLIGYSLGGHIVGFAGRGITSGTVPYITSLDPASLLWGPNSDRIRPSDGGYVEVIHTNTAAAGVEDPVGHNDFYPNGGRTMPGCGVLDFDCSHFRAVEYFAYSIDHTGFMSAQCLDYPELAGGQCSNLSQLHMGGASPKEARGVFWLATSDVPPFYLGVSK